MEPSVEERCRCTEGARTRSPSSDDRLRCALEVRGLVPPAEVVPWTFRGSLHGSKLRQLVELRDFAVLLESGLERFAAGFLAGSSCTASSSRGNRCIEGSCFERLFREMLVVDPTLLLVLPDR